jgi:hypothetical protein
MWLLHQLDPGEAWTEDATHTAGIKRRTDFFSLNPASHTRDFGYVKI